MKGLTIFNLVMSGVLVCLHAVSGEWDMSIAWAFGFFAQIQLVTLRYE